MYDSSFLVVSLDIRISETKRRLVRKETGQTEHKSTPDRLTPFLRMHRSYVEDKRSILPVMCLPGHPPLKLPVTSEWYILAHWLE